MCLRYGNVSHTTACCKQDVLLINNKSKFYTSESWKLNSNMETEYGVECCNIPAEMVLLSWYYHKDEVKPAVTSERSG